MAHPKPTLHLESHGLKTKHAVSSGSPVVLLPGMFGSSRYWQKVTRRLDKNRPCYSLDLLGFGRSPKPKQAQYSLDDHCQAVLRTLEKHQIPTPLTLAAHSMGAIIALELASRYPDIIERLILCNMPLLTRTKLTPQQVSELLNTPQWWLFGPIARARKAWRVIAPFAVSVIPSMMQSYVPLDVARDALRLNWWSYSRSLQRVVIGTDVIERLQAVNVPTTLMYGNRDYLSHRTGRLIGSAFGNERVAVKLVSASHHLPLERPEAIAGLINLQPVAVQ